MKQKIDISKAKEIIKAIAANRLRWGRHAGLPGDYSLDQVWDALIILNESGVLEHEVDVDDLREQMTAANRARGAAEAREKKYKGQLDNANDRIKELTIALEDEQYARSELNDKLHALEIEYAVVEGKLSLYEEKEDGSK